MTHYLAYEKISVPPMRPPEIEVGDLVCYDFATEEGTYAVGVLVAIIPKKEKRYMIYWLDRQSLVAYTKEAIVLFRKIYNFHLAGLHW
jgi:hypothetical protein